MKGEHPYRPGLILHFSSQTTVLGGGGGVFVSPSTLRVSGSDWGSSAETIENPGVSGLLRENVEQSDS